MAKKHGPNKENLEATRRVFMKIARNDFSTVGYYAASTAQIVETSGMARGSLYYHFGDKKGLFRAVYEELMEEMSADIADSIADKNDPWEAMIAGCMRCLDLLTKSETRRIVVDVHTALTYAERIEILQRTLLALLGKLLEQILQAGYFAGHNTKTLSIMIFGFLSEGGRSFELASDVQQARADLGTAFIALMEKARA